MEHPTAKHKMGGEAEGGEGRGAGAGAGGRGNTVYSYKSSYTEVAHRCRGRPRLLLEAHCLGEPSALQSMCFAEQDPLPCAILVYSATCLSNSISGSGFDPALSSTVALARGQK
eukprot:4269366-Pyramimonas_sp.AAC.1